jgi:hypothetical protein
VARTRIGAVEVVNASATAIAACASDTTANSRLVSKRSTSRPEMPASRTAGDQIPMKSAATAIPEPVVRWMCRESGTSASQSPERGDAHGAGESWKSRRRGVPPR